MKDRWEFMPPLNYDYGMIATKQEKLCIFAHFEPANSPVGLASHLPSFSSI